METVSMERNFFGQTTTPSSNILVSSLTGFVFDNHVLRHLADKSRQKQWILFTAECQRPCTEQLEHFQIHCDKIIQIKASQTKNEFEVASQAILSGNASTVVASENLTKYERESLKRLGRKIGCEVFFISARKNTIH